ncbi:MAG: C40 family peptidase, partial [Cytophagaceae bacterium]
DSLAVRGNHGKSKVYVRTLAGHFKDTLALYSTYFPPPFPKTVKATIPEKKSNSVPKNGASSTLTSSSKEKRVSRTQVIQYAEKFKGVPYKWGGEDSSGFDCSGFVLAVMRKFGYSFNHGAKDQSELGRAVERESLKSGDLVFFGKKYDTGRYKIDHVGIVHTVDKDKLIVIHCTSRGVNVQEMKAGEYWSRKILFYRNIID